MGLEISCIIYIQREKRISQYIINVCTYYIVGHIILLVLCYLTNISLSRNDWGFLKCFLKAGCMYVHCKFRPKLLQTFAIKNLMRNAKGFFFNSRAMDYSGRKVDLCHEVLMYQFSYLLYDKIFSMGLFKSQLLNYSKHKISEQWRFKGTISKECEKILSYYNK